MRIRWLALAAAVASWSGAGGASAQVLVGGLELEAEWTATGVAGSALDHPMGIAVDSRDRVLVADGSPRIVVYNGDGTPLDTWSLPPGTRPVGLAARPDGSLLVTDYTGDRVLVLDAAGVVVDTWGERGTGPGQFQAPSGVAVTSSGHVVVVEFMGQRVQELDGEGNFVRFREGGTAARAHVQERKARPGMDEMAMAMSGPPPPGNPDALFVFPTDVAVGPDGTVYISNTHGYEILVFGPDGELRAAWGSKGAEAGEWEVPVGLATDARGDLYVADSANFRVQGLDPHGRPFLVSRADERWYRTTRRIYSPTDVALDSQGRLYVVDFAASRIQRFRVERSQPVPPAQGLSASSSSRTTRRIVSTR